MPVPPQSPPPDSNLGKWDAWYQELAPDEIGAFRYGDTVTYRMASAFMADVEEVEDWGCGAGGFKRFYRGRYIGVDGSKTPVADRIVDLRHYTSRVEGIVMRHVLEHNYCWHEILDGAVHSFTRKFCLILFTPFSETTHEIAHNKIHGVDVPDLSFNRSDIEASLAGLRWELLDNIPTDSGYNVEHVYLVWREGATGPGGARLQRLGQWLGVGTTAIAQGFERADRRDLKRRLLRRSSKRAVLTAIFGQYDSLKDIPKTDNDAIDYICFTDNPDLVHAQWQVRRVDSRFPHPRLDAKYYKAVPHQVLPEYDETLWVDASFQIEHPGFPEDAFEYLAGAGIALFLHPDRGCIYDEAAFCKGMPKYLDQKVLEQVEHYRLQGYPEGRGLFAGGIIARRTHDSRIQRLNELWMQENLRWTYQDQLSLPYLFWKLNVKPSIFRHYLWRNEWGTWEPHAHDE